MAQIRVMQSAAFKEAYLELVPEFEAATGHRIESLWVSTVNMLSRLQSGGTVDLVIAPTVRMDEMTGAGLIAPASRTDVARSGIGVAIRAGAPRPDISSAEALKRAVLAARSLVYSTGPSGIYLARLFERMGISGAIQSKVKQITGEPTGAVVARGEAEIGFQQMSELLPISGIDLAGPLPAEIQEITTFTAGVPLRASEPGPAKALIAHFKATAAHPVIRKWGMEPA